MIHPTNEPEYVGDCSWCSDPVYSDDEYEAGDDGEGVMHKYCHEVEYNRDDPEESLEEYYEKNGDL